MSVSLCMSVGESVLYVSESVSLYMAVGKVCFVC